MNLKYKAYIMATNVDFAPLFLDFSKNGKIRRFH